MSYVFLGCNSVILVFSANQLPFLIENIFHFLHVGKKYQQKYKHTQHTVLQYFTFHKVVVFSYISISN